MTIPRNEDYFLLNLSMEDEQRVSALLNQRVADAGGLYVLVENSDKQGAFVAVVALLRDAKLDAKADWLQQFVDECRGLYELWTRLMHDLYLWSVDGYLHDGISNPDDTTQPGALFWYPDRYDH